MSQIQMRNIFIIVLYFHQEKLEVFGIGKLFYHIYIKKKTLPRHLFIINTSILK